MKREDWEEAIRGKTGEFVIDPVVTPMASVLDNYEVVGCIVKNLGSNEYSLHIYRYEDEDEKMLKKDPYKVHTAFGHREDFNQLIPSSTDNNENMQKFLNDTVMIEIEPKKTEDHHLSIDKWPTLLTWIKR